jgi:subtilisin family serine protease
MNLDNAPLGHAFDDDYPEAVGEDAAVLQQIVQRQREELTKLQADTARRPAILSLLRGRRCGRTDLPQLDFMARKDGADAVTAYGEIVMSAESYDVVDVQALLQSHGFGKPHGRSSQPGAVVRLRNPMMPIAQVERMAADLADQGHSAWVNYMAALAAVGKGLGGPEPVGGLGNFGDYGLGSTGTPARVAFVDTGIPLDGRDDGWLTNIQRTNTNIDLLDNLPCGRDGYLDFQAGHGAFVAGIVQRVAPRAHVRVYRAADTDGFASDSDVADAMIQAFEEGAQIINLSLGGQTADDVPPRATVTAVETIRAASGDEVVIVAAAGNFGDEVPCWPAQIDGVVSVAGLTADLAPAPWSSHGEVRLSAVGEGIRSTFVEGNESPVFDREPEVFPHDAWAVWTGTSFAAPQIAGAVARICQELGVTPREAVQLLDDRGLPIDGYGKAMRILRGIG